MMVEQSQMPYIGEMFQGACMCVSGGGRGRLFCAWYENDDQQEVGMKDI